MTHDLAAIDRITRRGRMITLAGFLGLVGVYILSLAYTPAEKMQGLAFKILYVHAPSAWAMEMAFVLVGIVGILYFWLQDERLDVFAEASATVGMVFATVLLTTGTVNWPWARPMGRRCGSGAESRMVSRPEAFSGRLSAPFDTTCPWSSSTSTVR